MDFHDAFEEDSLTSECPSPSSDNPSDNGLDLTDEDFRDELQHCLDDMKHQGTFFSMTTTSLYINPGLKIKGVGSIGLPLTDGVAHAVAGVCKQSPFGKGDVTLVDESVRKTWELDTTEFSCCNPSWSQYIKTLAEQVMQNLGVEAPGRAEAYKLLLYEEGAFFRAHRDTEKVSGMFGTLVVCLPSKHTGGEVRLRHDGKEQIIETAPTSAFDLTALAWYSDVQHEIKPVKSGYRLVLTYNLVQDRTFPQQSAAALDDTASKLERLLRIWQSQSSYHKTFFCPLKHRYTQASLSQSQLKGEDGAKCRYIEQVSGRNNIYWFLSHMIKETQEDYYDDDDDEDSETDITFREIFTPLGKSINLDLLYIDDTQILADVDDLYGRTADSEDEGEYTGNENMPSTFRYHNTVAVMMQKDLVIAQFGKRDHKATSLMAMFELVRDDEHCRSDLQREAMRILLQKAMGNITHRESRTERPYISMYSYSGISAEQDREKKSAEYAKVFEEVSEFCYVNGLGDVVAAELRDAMQKESWHESKELVGLLARYVAKVTAEGQSDAWGSWLSVPLPEITTYKFVSERLKILDAVKGTLPASSAVQFDGWKQAQLDTYLDTVMSFSQQDALPVLELIPVVGKRKFFDTFIPNMTRKPHAAGLARFLQLLSQKADKDDTLGDIERETFQKLVPALRDVYQLTPNNLASRSYPREPPTLSAASNEFIALVQRCRTVLQLPDEALSLFSNCLPELSEPDATFWADWRSLFIFIKAILKLVEPKPDKAMHKVASSFITQAVQGLATHRATSRPQEPRDWACPSTPRDKCSCKPCAELTTFLHDPNQQTARFSYAEKIRKHLQYTLDSRDFNFDTERTRSPYTLVVTKTKNEYDRTLREWEEDVRQFKHELAGLRRGLMYELLDGDVVDKSGIDEALETNGAGGRKGTQPLQPASATSRNVGRRPAVAGTKRKSDVIDLTEDDTPPPGSNYPRGPVIA